MKSTRTLLVLNIMVLFSLPQGVSAQWEKTVGNGLSDNAIFCLATKDSNLFASTSGNLFRSPDNGTNWTSVHSNLPAYQLVHCMAVCGTMLFAGMATDSGKLYMSIDDGDSWIRSDSGLRYSIYSLMVNGADLFAGTTGNGVFLSKNNGKNWAAVSTGLPKNTWVYSLAESETDLYAATEYGVFHSTDNGSQWIQINYGLADTQVNAIAIIGGNLIAGTYSGIFLSTNNGTSWNQVALYSGTIYSLLVHGSRIFAGTGGNGVLVSTDYGVNWNMTSMGGIVYCLAANEAYLFAGTTNPGSGIWRFPLSATDTKNKAIGTRACKIFKVLQSQFSSNLSITFSLSQSERVSAKIYNVAGSTVATLVDEYLEAGTHCLTLDARNIAAGCYTVRMQAGPNSYVKRVPFLR